MIRIQIRNSYLVSVKDDNLERRATINEVDQCLYYL